MGQALLATWRVEQNYSVGGVAHVLHHYCKGVVAGGSDHTLTDRNGAAVDFLVVATGFKNNHGGLLGAGLSWGACELQQLVGGRWLTQRVWSVSAPGGVGTAKLGSVVTATFRDTAILPIKLVMLDTNQAPPYHYIDATGGDANLDSLLSTYGDRGGVHPEDPYFWVVSRGNRYLSTSPFVSVSCDIDRTTKKAHGL